METAMERERIVVGVDGSAGSHAALRWALAHGRQSGADVDVEYCWAPPFAAMASGYALAYVTTEEISAEGNAHLEAAMTACRDEVEASRAAGVVVSTHVLEGDASASLVSESKNAAMVVVGRRGHGGLSRLVLGSVSRYVASHAHCPVVVVPEPDGE
jgi:nucleotide-binding universal stress UspA family protein